MTKKLRVLHLEGVAADAEHVSMVLKKSNLRAEILVVDNKEAYVTALIEYVPHVILSDHSLPTFTSEEALNIFLQSGLKIPFILVTATMSEEYAVSVIKAGAADYILKEHLDMLHGAIIHSIEKIESETNLEIQKALFIKEKTNAVLVAHEEERRQTANELLENINQILAASNLYIDCAISEEDKRMEFMHSSKQYILMAIDEIKKLSQVIMPPTLEEIGLIESLNNWIDFKHQQNGMNLVTKWKNFNSRILNAKLQLTIYRIVQEQLNNTIKYSKAQNVFITIVQTKHNLQLMIKDDGVGFDTAAVTNGVGLKNISTRAEIHNGKMLLESQPGKGCSMTVDFPI